MHLSSVDCPVVLPSARFVNTPLCGPAQNDDGALSTVLGTFPREDAPSTSVVEAIVCEGAPPRSTLGDELRELGVVMARPEALDSISMEEALNRVLIALHICQVIVVHSAHLSVRTLYARLWEVVEIEALRAPREGERYELDMIDLSRAFDRDAWLRFYASDAEREAWKVWSPEGGLPARGEPPFARRVTPRWSVVHEAR